MEKFARQFVKMLILWFSLTKLVFINGRCY